jgi:hypothetical protein
VQHAYTENHVNSPAMYQEVRKGIHELGKFEDIVQDGEVMPAKVGLWCSETADVWNNHKSPFDAAKRCLYAMLRHAELPLDFVVDGDDLQAYKVLFLPDANVSRSGSKAIADWVSKGGHLVATAGAGMFDEFNQPNKILRDLLGVNQTELIEAKDLVIRFEKQDLPWAKPLGRVGKAEVYGVRSRIEPAKGTEVVLKFEDGAPAASTRAAGAGQAQYWAFLPGLTYFSPSFPRRPMDRGATDQHMTHFLPTSFDPSLEPVLARLREQWAPCTCSTRLVETTIVQSKHGTLVPLINWNREPIKKLEVRVSLPVPTAHVTLASGRPVQMSRQDKMTVFTLDLDVADALILR